MELETSQDSALAFKLIFPLTRFLWVIGSECCFFCLVCKFFQLLPFPISSSKASCFCVIICSLRPDSNSGFIFSHILSILRFPNEMGRIQLGYPPVSWLRLRSPCLVALLRLAAPYTSAMGKIKCPVVAERSGCQSCPSNHQIDYKSTVVAGYRLNDSSGWPRSIPSSNLKLLLGIWTFDKWDRFLQPTGILLLNQMTHFVWWSAEPDCFWATAPPAQWSKSAKVRILLFCQSFRSGLTAFVIKPSANGSVSSSIRSGICLSISSFSFFESQRRLTSSLNAAAQIPSSYAR